MLLVVVSPLYVVRCCVCAKVYSGDVGVSIYVYLSLNVCFVLHNQTGPVLYNTNYFGWYMELIYKRHATRYTLRTFSRVCRVPSTLPEVRPCSEWPGTMRIKHIGRSGDNTVASVRWTVRVTASSFSHSQHLSTATNIQAHKNTYTEFSVSQHERTFRCSRDSVMLYSSQECTP